MAKNKIQNTIVKEKIRDYIADSWESLIRDIDSLDAKERVDRRMKLLEYIMPKAAALKMEEKKSVSIAQVILGKESAFEDYREEDSEDEEDTSDTEGIEASDY